MTEEKKKQLYDKFFELADGTSLIFFLKEPIKVKGTKDGMLDNINTLTSLIKDNNTWYYDNFDKGTTFDIRIMKFGDKIEEVEEIPQEGVCLLYIQHGDINEVA